MWTPSSLHGTGIGSCGPSERTTLIVTHATVPVHHYAHHPECHTAKCAHHADKLWYRRHKPRGEAITLFDLCVANREQGEPGSTDPRFINWKAVQDPYHGGFSMEHSKWEEGGGLKYAYDADGATATQQVAVFHRLGREGQWTSGNWPTIPPCRGMPGS